MHRLDELLRGGIMKWSELSLVGDLGTFPIVFLSSGLVHRMFPPTFESGSAKNAPLDSSRMVWITTAERSPRDLQAGGAGNFQPTRRSRSDRVSKDVERSLSLGPSCRRALDAARDWYHWKSTRDSRTAILESLGLSRNPGIPVSGRKNVFSS